MEPIAISINAGMDMVMVPTRYREYFNDLKALVNEGKVPMSRIDDAVLRILRVKFAMGLMDRSASAVASIRFAAIASVPIKLVMKLFWPTQPDCAA